MSMQQTPVIADSETVETLKLAEDISMFFEDQKLKAQDRIRQCEAFINNLHLPSKSVKEGLASLRQNAEDDYSTLLHLERVLNMRDGGDFIPTLDTPIIHHAMIGTAFSNSLPGFTGTGSSGDHIGLSGGSSHLHKNARMSTGTHSSSYQDDGHGVGTGFTMGGKVSEGQNVNPEYDENFDPLLPDDSFSLDDETNAQGESNLGRNRKSPTGLNRNPNNKKDGEDHIVKDHGEPCEEADEEEDYFVEKELPQGRMIGIREQRGSNLQQTMARSLPVSVPLPEGLPKRGSIFDLASDEGDEESDGEKENGPSITKEKPGRRRRPDIPQKIAQIAKSMYDRDGFGFGESPQKN